MIFIEIMTLRFKNIGELRIKNEIIIPLIHIDIENKLCEHNFKKRRKKKHLFVFVRVLLGTELC